MKNCRKNLLLCLTSTSNFVISQIEYTLKYILYVLLEKRRKVVKNTGEHRKANA